MSHEISELNKFIQDQRFNDQILATILKNIISEYPGESLRQHAIRAMIMFFENKYRNEYETRYDKQIKKKRELSKNKYSADAKEDIRRAFSMPETLVSRIDGLLGELIGSGKLPEKEPRFMSDEAIKEHDEATWFCKNFPRYVIPQEF